MKVVYIAGPYRGRNNFEIAENVRAAERLALKVWQLGGVALCPHANTAHFQGCLADETWLRGDLELLRRCDAVLLTPDWQRSEGAKAERAYAEQIGMPVMETIGQLIGFLR